jgi:tape measure domain-containing protein
MNLSATFKLFDGYSSTADKVSRKTDQATNKILNASGATDKFNRRLEATGASAGKASGGLGKFISMAVLVGGALKGMNIDDNYTNTGARLKLINDGLQTQAELQDKIMASANRSRGAYGEIAAAIGKMGINAADAFGSNDELIEFTELVQKSFKVGGATSGEQSSAMLQLTQAMSAGVLQGDEFRSIADAAPLILNAVAKYTGKSRGELKKLAAEGYITSEMMKKAMFMASKDINGQFATMPMTFTDIWNRITNDATDAFGPLMKRISNIINGDKFRKFLDKIEMGLYGMANAADKALDGMIGIYDYISSNWNKIEPIVYGAVAAWGAYKLALLGVKAAQWAVNLVTMANPIGLVIVLVTALAAAFVMLWEKSEGFRSFFTNMWAENFKSLGHFYNVFTVIYNEVYSLQNKITTFLQAFVLAFGYCASAAIEIGANMAKAIISSFGFIVDAINLTIAQYNQVAKLLGMKTIDVKFNKDGLSGFIDGAAQDAIYKINGTTKGLADILEGAKEEPLKKVDELLGLEKTPSVMDNKKNLAFSQNRYEKDLLGLTNPKFDDVVEGMAGKLKNFTISGWLKDTFSSLTNELTGAMKGFDNPLNLDDPLLVEGTGANGSIQVDMSTEDLRYLRDIAEREYINKFSTATLAPNVSFTFGDIHEKTDVNELKGTLEMLMREEIAVAAEGAY